MILSQLLHKDHFKKLASEGDRAGIEADEQRYGFIPADLKKRLLATCTLQLAPEVVLWGTGTPRREFLYSDDMAEACLYLLNLPDEKFDTLLWPAGSPLNLVPWALPLSSTSVAVKT